MKSLNRAERNSAFLGFLLLFFITIGLVVVAFFFSMEVPFKENEQLRKKIAVLETEKELADSFNVAMNIAMNELTNFDLKKEPAEATKVSVQMKISRMSELIKDIPNSENSIYTSVIRNLIELNDAKTKLRNLEDGKNYAQQQ